MTRRPLLTLGALLAGGCNLFSPTGTLSAHWATHADTASVVLPVTATWCVGADRLDIRAMAGDTGLGVTIYPADSGTLAGSYDILEPGGQVTIRPSAATAVRWMGKVLVLGWWGDSGAVTLEGGRARGFSGEGRSRLVSGLGRDSLGMLEFTFRGVRVRNDTLCDAPALPVATPLVPADTNPSAGVD